MFRYSELSRLIDTTDTAILSNITTIRMYKTLTPQLNTVTQYTTKFYNQFLIHTLDMVLFYRLQDFKISGSTAEQFLDDDGRGNVRIFKVESNQKIYANASVGTIDYAEGTVVLNNINVTSTTNTDGTIHDCYSRIK